MLTSFFRGDKKGKQINISLSSRNRKILKIAAFFFVGLLVIFVCINLIFIAQVNSQIGFSYATPYDEQGDEIFVITEIVPGGAMDKAGFMKEDRILFESVNTLYNKFIFNQGRHVNIPVKRGDRYMNISVHVPILDLLFRPEWFYWVGDNENSIENKNIRVTSTNGSIGVI
jgi:hypothetical protein